MRLHVLSDLHMEFLSPRQKREFLDTLEETRPDYLILAGDITHDFNDVLEILERIRPDDYVYINGNHEYYSKYSPAGEDTWVDENIVAATMWFPRDRDPVSRGCMNDFIHVPPEWCFHRNKDHMEFLHENLRPVVVTHHLPHEDCIAPKYKRMLTNQYFLCPTALDELTPKLWIHGHTHCTIDKMIGNTRVVCNPRGYPRELNDFEPNLVIEC